MMAAAAALALASGVVTGQVVINEIAWAGTAAGASDEWIELYNPTEDDIDLSGWTLRFGERAIRFADVEAGALDIRRTEIEAGGYFLLERTDDTSVANVEADVIYRGGLSNAGVDLQLLDAEGHIVDEALFSEGGWPAGTSSGAQPPYASMERVDAHATEWRTNDGVIRDGLDAEGGPINGTPGAENAATVLAARAPRVELLAPSAEGEVLSGTYEIEWSAVDPDDPSTALGVSVYLSADEGTTWNPVAENLTNTGSYLWDTVGVSNGEGFLLRLRVVDPDGYAGHAASSCFRIDN